MKKLAGRLKKRMRASFVYYYAAKIIFIFSTSVSDESMTYYIDIKNTLYSHVDYSQ